MQFSSRILVYQAALPDFPSEIYVHEASKFSFWEKIIVHMIAPAAYAQLASKKSEDQRGDADRVSTHVQKHLLRIDVRNSILILKLVPSIIAQTAELSYILIFPIIVQGRI